MIISRFENSPSREETRDARTRTIDAERAMFRTLTLRRIGARFVSASYFSSFSLSFLTNYVIILVCSWRWRAILDFNEIQEEKNKIRPDGWREKMLPAIYYSLCHCACSAWHEREWI